MTLLGKQGIFVLIISGKTLDYLVVPYARSGFVILQRAAIDSIEAGDESKPGISWG